MAKPTLDRAAAEAMNLAVLKRIDPAIEEVRARAQRLGARLGALARRRRCRPPAALDPTSRPQTQSSKLTPRHTTHTPHTTQLLATAGHVALYDFDPAGQKWARKGVEGGLFVVKRAAAPRFRFVVLNKKGADNFAQDVGGAFACEVKEPYCLYRDAAGGVVGVWFYDAADLARIATLLQRIAATFAAPADAPAGAAPVAAPPAPAPIAAAPAAAPAAPADGADADAFWDARVTVPAELPAPGGGPPPAASAPPPAPAPSANPLARLFAGLTAAAPPAAAVPPPPPAPSPPAAPALPLLTPQFLQRATPPPPAAASATANAGALLLQSLRGGPPQPAAAQQPQPPPQQQQAPPAADAARLAALLRAMADDAVLCAGLAAAARRAGLLA
jgi:mRNA-decapping enzyme 1B